MSAISFAVQVIPDKFQLFEANSDASLEQILPKILKSSLGNSLPEEINLKDYRILIAYQLANPETNAATVAINASAPLSTQDFTIRDLKLKNGFFLIFVKLPISTAKLELSTLGRRLALLDGRDEYLLGRTDDDHDIFPDIDITQYLGKDNENKVSRQQSIIFAEDGKWKIRLHKDARTFVFLNNEQIEYGRAYDIQDDVVINLGSDPEKPVLRILTRLIAE